MSHRLTVLWTSRGTKHFTNVFLTKGMESQKIVFFYRNLQPCIGKGWQEDGLWQPAIVSPPTLKSESDQFLLIVQYCVTGCL
jgi:hypothetical protein